MNNSALHDLVKCYMEQFESFVLGNGGNECNLWKAAQHVKENWDVEAVDFASMFKSSMKKTGDLIEQGKEHPLSGILFLCENGYAQEVRMAFRNLLKEDEGNYKTRLHQMDRFEEAINGFLREVNYEKGKYSQKRRHVLAYLALIRPESDYFYKQTEVNSFAAHMEFGETIGTEKLFSLSLYYKLCSQLTDYLKQQQDITMHVFDFLNELSSRHSDNYRYTPSEVDSEYHILTYHIMHCAHVCKLYSQLNIKKHIGTLRDKTIISEQIDEIYEYITNRMDVDQALQDIMQKKQMITYEDMDGKSVLHPKYGTGVVVRREDNHIWVRFTSEDKKFQLPKAFSQGFLRCSDEEILARCSKHQLLEEQEEQLLKKLKVLNDKIEELEYLEKNR